MIILDFSHSLSPFQTFNQEYAFFLCDTSCDWKINGKLKAERSTHSVGYSDGQSHVTVTYAMQPDVVEPY